MPQLCATLHGMPGTSFASCTLVPWTGLTVCMGLGYAWCKEIRLKHFECLPGFKIYAFDRWFCEIPYSSKRPKRRHLPYVDSPKNADWHVERRHGATKRFALRCFATRPLCHENIDVIMSAKVKSMLDQAESILGLFPRFHKP